MRSIVRKAGAAVVAALCGQLAAQTVNYDRPFEPATRPAFIPLPPGAVEPRGWLRDWCLAARDNYVGHMEEVDIAFKQAWAADHKMYGDNLKWRLGGWPYEGGGYWFEGLTHLAYALKDEALIAMAKAKFEPVIAGMNEQSILFMWWLDRNKPEDLKSGEGRHFGDPEWPMWVNGLFGRSLATYVHASRDERAMRALDMAYSTGKPEWLAMGWSGSNIFPSYEAYTWSKNPRLKEALDLLFVDPADRTTRPRTYSAARRLPPKGRWPMGGHGVSWLEATSPWVVGYLWTGNRLFLEEPLALHRAVEEKSMQPIGVIVSDEFIGPRGAFRMSETCDVAATLWAKNLHMAISGEGYLGDQVERAAFNAAPATTARDFKSHVYLQSPNRISAKLSGHGHNAYHRKHGPLCCTAALTRIVPLFVSNLWMATDDNGLAFTSYAPCTVTARVANKQTVEMICTTDYPFNQTIAITVKPQSPDAVTFPLLLRLPGWCRQPSIKVNDAVVEAKADKQFVRIERAWKAGDTVRLEFPMEVRIDNGYDTNSKPPAPYASVSYGPLLFSLPIAEIDANNPVPKVKWGYALAAAASEISVLRTAMPAKWDWPADPPLKLQAKGIFCDWINQKPKRSLPSEVIADGPSEDITLVPHGCTHLRISMFPVTAKVAPAPLPTTPAPAKK